MWGSSYQFKDRIAANGPFDTDTDEISLFVVWFLWFPQAFKVFGIWKHTRGANLDSHVGVGENHVEVIVGHAELFPELCDQFLVHHVLLPQTLHRLVIFCTNRSNSQRPTLAVCLQNEPITQQTCLSHQSSHFLWSYSV